MLNIFKLFKTSEVEPLKMGDDKIKLIDLLEGNVKYLTKEEILNKFTMLNSLDIDSIEEIYTIEPVKISVKFHRKNGKIESYKDFLI